MSKANPILSVPAKLETGKPHPMGAVWDGSGVNFAVFSEDADEIRLCLFDERNREQRLVLPGRTCHIFHGYLPGAGPGLRYGFRAWGPYKPQQGLRFNPNKLLLDPYARHWVGNIKLDDRDFSYVIGSPEEDLTFDSRDNGDKAPKCLVVDSAFDWQGIESPGTKWSDTIIYEAHVKGCTKLHPHIPPESRGRYAGLWSPPMLEHFRRLGITAVELLPVHSIVHDRRLRELGLSNYWGYGNIGYFRPEADYAQHDPILEFKTMVRELHRAGLEVILDVVYNHTGEGNQLGPTLCFRGLCNRSYYRLDPERNRFYRDYTGCGNTVNVDHPQVLQMVMDSLRFWVEEMHVDGFRYDLATALARHQSSFLDAVHQDPVLKGIKLIAEPWDCGEGGYQAGNFPAGWSEWNDRYRDTVRRFWKGDSGMICHLAERLTGSADLFSKGRRGPTASINFVTCHDGFTLRDLVSFNHKHNQANGEENRDGSNCNHSHNYGEEGFSNDPALNQLRLQQMKNLLATLYLSIGVPMVLGGDELGHSQQGNNNAYCQDNPLSWYEWTETEHSQEILRFVQKLSNLRFTLPHFRRTTHLGDSDALWLHPAGHAMRNGDWHDPASRCLGLCLLEPPRLFLVVSSSPEPVRFRLEKRAGRLGKLLLETAKCKWAPREITLPGRSLALFQFE